MAIWEVTCPAHMFPLISDILKWICSFPTPFYSNPYFIFVINFWKETTIKSEVFPVWCIAVTQCCNSPLVIVAALERMGPCSGWVNEGQERDQGFFMIGEREGTWPLVSVGNP